MLHCQSEHLSHGEYASMCGKAAHEKRLLVTHVQVKTFGQGISKCGVIKDAYTIDGRDFFKIKLDEGPTMTFSALHVRKCSGLDGKCECAGEC